MNEVVSPAPSRHNGAMNNNTITNIPDLGMFTDGGNRALALALLDALQVPAHEFPDDWETDVCEWFADWVSHHPTHSQALKRHDEWTDTDVRDSIGWVLENPKRGLSFLTR